MGIGAGRPCPRAAVGAILVALAAARIASQATFDAAQTSSAGQRQLDALTSDLSARIVSSVSPATAVSLAVLPDDVAVVNAMTARLGSAGIRIVDAAPGIPAVRVSCFENLRERVCSAEVTANVRTTFIVTRPHDDPAAAAVPGLALELRSTFSQRTRILDIAAADDDLLVLGPTGIARYEQIDGRWRNVEFRAISQPRPWPRDVRGRLRVASDKVEAFLPGVTCVGGASPLSLVCADGVAPWPLAIENASLDPSRNFFRTPEGFSFYGVAPLGAGAGARFVAATVDHTLAWVDDGRQSIAAAIAGDDVVAVGVPCAGGSYVVASSPAADRDADQLRLFQVTARRLIPAASPLVVAGKLTALWPVAGGTATVITHDRDRDRYDAHQLAVSCSR